MSSPSAVTVRRKSVLIPTYAPHRPDPNPMFLEKRVYQGSSGRVYPLPFIDRVEDKPRPHEWDAIFMENEYLRITLLPQLGGRIHRLQDKTNGYDAIYHQPVIKPALVGLAGPWCSGGIEFNWPQHHRPSTFMPADVEIERHEDGSATVWFSEHDPMARMKGMHGVRLHPGRSYLELVARAYNRTSDVQTFLWWANVATRVHEAYQSFFPPDVTYVADHAKRAMSTFPHSSGHYYGVDYAARGREGVPVSEVPRQFVPPHCRTVTAAAGPEYRPDDLSWYANIPVPTSYMCMGSSEDFAGGYDYKAAAGLVHVANHHISPGKKQWTWGNHEFGYAWDRNLTDPDENGEYGPYIELMAGVYTDNQPDFSFLQPGETKSWSQFWYPIRSIGPAQKANVDAAVSLGVRDGVARIGVAVTASHADAVVRLERDGRVCAEWRRPIAPDNPFIEEARISGRNGQPGGEPRLTVRVIADGRELIRHAPKPVAPGKVPPAATEPAAPKDVRSADELYVIGLHLEQYRHATRMPQDYWREALRRDPGDSRCNLALGRWHLRRGEPADAERHLRASIERAISRNPNPYDGEPYYQLGQCLRLQAFSGAAHDTAKLDAAYAAYYKATWSHAWQPAAFHALAEIDCLRGDSLSALDHLERALRLNADNLRARDLKAVVLRKVGRTREADALLEETLALDPLDWWARWLRRPRQVLGCDNQVRFDLALDCVRAGLFADALELLSGAREGGPRNAGTVVTDANLGTAPLVHYYRGWISQLAGDRRAAGRHLAAAARANPEYCFPARLEEIGILSCASEANPRDAQARLFLGNLLYDRRRHDEAIGCWELAVKLDPRNAVAWRNLGIAYWNIQHDAKRARAAYERAFRARSDDARLLFERDQLWKRLGVSPVKRLRELRRHGGLVRQRDDLSIELCALLNQTGNARAALEVVSGRKFQPWEGGEGQALGQHVRTHLALGRAALALGRAAEAARHFAEALTPPANLGEARHILANQSDIHHWLGRALDAAGDTAGARAAWTQAAEFKGDFQGMSVRAYSEMTYYSALSLERLGREREAKRLLRELLKYARQLGRTKAKIEYFATSLPTMLLFDDDLQQRQETTALFLEAQARLGLGETAAARRLLREVLRRDPNHALAADLLG